MTESFCTRGKEEKALTLDDLEKVVRKLRAVDPPVKIWANTEVVREIQRDHLGTKGESAFVSHAVASLLTESAMLPRFSFLVEYMSGRKVLYVGDEQVAMYEGSLENLK